MNEAAIELIARWALGLLFAASAVAKLSQLRSFALGIVSYRLIPRRAAPVVAGVVVLAELVLAASFFSGMVVSAAALGAVALSAVFTAAIGINLVRGNRVACHCFGGDFDIERISLASLARSAAIGSLSLALATADGVGIGTLDGETTLACATVAIGLSVGLRLIGLLPAAVEFMKVPAKVRPKPTRRVSYTYHRPEDPLAVLRPTPTSVVEGPRLLAGAADE